MGLPNRIEEQVHRGATCSSTKNHLGEFGSNRNSKNKHKSVRERKEPDSNQIDSQQLDEPRGIQPIATSENVVVTSRIPEDINEEVKQELSRSSLPTPHVRIRFYDTPVFIEPEQKVDDYNIIHDIKDQKANITIGQVLHDNTNYQKLIRDAWIKRKKRRFKLPLVAINFLQVKDYCASKLTVEVDGCSVPKVPVDGGSGINLMLEDIAFDLEYTSFEATNQVLRMAD